MLQKHVKNEVATVQWDILKNPAQTFSFVPFLWLRKENRLQEKAKRSEHECNKSWNLRVQ